MQQKLKEHLINLLNALTNLSPSRNLISQLTLLLPKNIALIEHSYPELTNNVAKEVLSSLNIEFDKIVKRGERLKGYTRKKGFAEALYEHIHRIFNWLDEEVVRTEIAKMINKPLDFIPNPYAEWTRLVLTKLSKMSIGDKILSFLRMLITRNYFIVSRAGYSRGALQPDWQLFLNNVEKELKLNPAEIKEILKLTTFVDPYYREELSVERFAETTIHRYLLHSEYHLDLITEVQSSTGSGYHSWYDHRYELRHKETIRGLLEEFKDITGAVEGD